MKKFFLLLCATFILPFLLYAFLEEYFNPIGFSVTGDYFAYEKISIPDPMPYSTFEFVILDISENFPVISIQFETGEINIFDCIDYQKRICDFGCIEENLPYYWKKMMTLAKNEYEILSGELGTFIGNENGSDIIELSAGKRIILEEKKTGRENALMFETETIKITFNDGKETRVIHSDGDSPLGGDGAWEHVITGVYEYDPWIVVVVDTHSPGFEGMDNRIFTFFIYNK